MMKKVFSIVLLSLIAFGAHAQVELNEIVVTSTRATQKTPVAQVTLNSKEIKENNVRVDVPQLIELSPSVVSSSESGISTGNTSFRIRGTDATRTNITLDGVPLNDGESQAVFWVNMPDLTSSLNSIQIQRGVGASSNGPGAFGATVSLQSALPSNQPYAEVTSVAGAYNTFHNSIRLGTGRLGEHFSFDARYSNVQSDGYIERSWSNHQSIFASGAWQNGRTLIKATVLYGEQHTGISWNGVPGYAIDSLRYPRFDAGVPGYNPGINRRYNPAGEHLDNDGNIRYYDNQSDNYKQAHYILQGVTKLGAGWNMAAGLHLTRGTGYYEEYKLKRKLVEYGLPNIIMGSDTIKKSDLIRNKLMSNYFYGGTFSVNYTTQRLQWSIGGAANRYDGDHYGKVLWLRYNVGRVLDNEWYRNNGTKDDYNVYSKATWQLTNVISLYGDVQYRHIDYVMEGIDDDLAELDQAHHFDFVNPKGGVFLRFNPNHQAYASFSVANREPSRADFKDASKYGSRETPRSERLYDTEVGYKYTGRAASFGLNFYYMNYKDQLVLTGKMSSVGYPIMQNVAKSHRAGIELMAGVDLFRPLRLEGNLTLSRNKIKDFVAYTDQYSNSSDWEAIEQRVEYLGETNISFSPDITGSAQVRYQLHKNLSFLLVGRYVDAQYYDNTSSADRRLDDYFVSNFRTDYTLRVGGATISMQLLVNNLLNKEYITSAWVYRAVFANGDADYIENGFLTQAKRHLIAKLVVAF